MPLPLRAAIAGLPSYRPGKPAPLGPGGISYKLSSNENPYPPLPGVIEAVASASAAMNRYPDMANAAMTAAVTDRWGLDADQLAFGTGSVAVLYHLLQTVCAEGDEVVYAWRSFEAYPIAVQVTGATPVPVPLAPGAVHDLGAIHSAVTARTKAIVLCSPNNPTGPALEHAAVLQLAEAVRDDILIILDEAYVEFVTDPAAVRGLEILASRPNVAVLRTFSKAYGLAGFRVGFCVADPTVARAVRSVSLPFGVSVVAQAAVIASLAAEEALLARVQNLVQERDGLASGLRELGFDVPSAQGNFVWLPAGDQTTAYATAFAHAGLMVRPYAAGDPGDGARITVGETEANALVLAVAATLPR